MVLAHRKFLFFVAVKTTKVILTFTSLSIILVLCDLHEMPLFLAQPFKISYNVFFRFLDNS